MQADDPLLALGKPLLDRLALRLGQHLVELVGVVEHQHVVAAELLGPHVFPMLGDVHVEAVLMPEQHQPAIDLGDVEVPVIAVLE